MVQVAAGAVLREMNVDRPSGQAGSTDSGPVSGWRISWFDTGNVLAAV